MTTIVTTTGSNTTAIFADSGITSDLIMPDVRKITQQGNWLIACAGDARQADLIHYAVKYPKVPKALLSQKIEEWYKWIVLNVIPRIEIALDVKSKDEYNLEALLVTYGRAFYIATSLSVSTAAPYWAIGSGGNLAIGYLASAQYDDDYYKNHDLKCKYAVSIAQMHDESTRGKIYGYVSYNTGHIEAFD